MKAPNKDTLLQVKELVERWGDDAVTIAHKLNIDVETARYWIEVVINIWS